MKLTQLNTELLLQLNCLLQDKDPLVIKIFKFVPVSIFVPVSVKAGLTRDESFRVRVGSLSDSGFKRHRRSKEDLRIIHKRLPGFYNSLTPRQANNLAKQYITEHVGKFYRYSDC